MGSGVERECRSADVSRTKRRSSNKRTALPVSVRSCSLADCHPCWSTQKYTHSQTLIHAYRSICSSLMVCRSSRSFSQNNRKPCAVTITQLQSYRHVRFISPYIQQTDEILLYYYYYCATAEPENKTV